MIKEAFSIQLRFNNYYYYKIYKYEYMDSRLSIWHKIAL